MSSPPKNRDRTAIARPRGSQVARKLGCTVAAAERDSVMQMPSADLDRLGDEIAELSAHLQAATARLLELIREFDAQAEARESTRQRAGRALHVYPNDDGTAVLRGRLTPEVGALGLPALAAAPEKLYQQHRAQPAEGGPQ